LLPAYGPGALTPSGAALEDLAPQRNQSSVIRQGHHPSWGHPGSPALNALSVRNGFDESLIQLRCLRGARTANAGATPVFVYQGGWAYCEAGKLGCDHDFRLTGGLTRQQVEGGTDAKTGRPASVRSPRDDAGQGLVEYALIIAVIAVAVIIAMLFLRDQISNIFSNIGNNLT
jgi:pilus assembly protein Flp/PilA